MTDGKRKLSNLRVMVRAVAFQFERQGLKVAPKAVEQAAKRLVREHDDLMVAAR